MKKYMIFLSIFLLTAIVAYPQRGGGGNRGGGRGQQGQGRQQGTYQGSNQNGSGQTERRQSRINSQQRKQIGECNNVADGIRKQARNMSRTSRNNFDAGEARQQFSRLQDRIRTMSEEHNRLMEGMDSEQQQAFQKQIRNMNRLQVQLDNQVKQMNSDLGPANPDPKTVSGQARNIERTMNEWKKQYNNLKAQSD